MGWFGRKKSEEKIEDNFPNEDLSQNQFNPVNPQFQRPFLDPFAVSNNTEMQLVLRKLELLNVKIQQLEHRLQQLERIEKKIDTIEKIAIESQEPPKRW